MEFWQLANLLLDNDVELNIKREFNQCNVTVTKTKSTEENGITKSKIYSFTQMLPMNDHIERKLVDCIKFCLDKVMTEYKEDIRIEQNHE